MGSLTRSAILAAEDLKRERVEVPEWGGYVFVRTMTGTERDAFEAGLVQRRGPETERTFENYRARLLTYVIVDDVGAAVFAKEDDAKALGEKAIPALERCFEAATRLNAITERDVEAHVKNSAPGPSDKATSD